MRRLKSGAQYSTCASVQMFREYYHHSQPPWTYNLYCFRSCRAQDLNDYEPNQKYSQFKMGHITVVNVSDRTPHNCPFCLRSCRALNRKDYGFCNRCIGLKFGIRYTQNTQFRIVHITVAWSKYVILGPCCNVKGKGDRFHANNHVRFTEKLSIENKSQKLCLISEFQFLFTKSLKRKGVSFA